MILLLGLSFLGVGFFIMNQENKNSNVTNTGRLYNLKDVDPSQQKGTYKTDYDILFESVAEDSGVPFALLKAHALAESSLSAGAFTDENPKKIASRNGWASRGLMQILFWPGSTRLEQFGFSSNDLDGGKELFNPLINIRVGAEIIKQNLKSSNGNLRDAINMYNTGKKESVVVAPYGYVDKVLKYYNTILGE